MVGDELVVVVLSSIMLEEEVVVVEMSSVEIDAAFFTVTVVLELLLVAVEACVFFPLGIRPVALADVARVLDTLEGEMGVSGAGIGGRVGREVEDEDEAVVLKGLDLKQLEGWSW